MWPFTVGAFWLLSLSIRASFVMVALLKDYHLVLDLHVLLNGRNFGNSFKLIYLYIRYSQMISGPENPRRLCRPFLLTRVNGWSHFQIGNVDQMGQRHSY